MDKFIKTIGYLTTLFIAFGRSELFASSLITNNSFSTLVSKVNCKKPKKKPPGGYSDLTNQNLIATNKLELLHVWGYNESAQLSKNYLSSNKEERPYKRLSDNYLKKLKIDAECLKKEILGKTAILQRYELFQNTETKEIVIFLKG